MELKQSAILQTAIIELTFNWTNMELKLFFVFCDFSFNFLLIEPIWNWNYLDAQRYAKRKIF